MDNVIAVSAGLNHTMAIQSDGSLWAWGRNVHGQLGIADIDTLTTTQHSPIHIMDNVAFVEAGRYHTMAIGTDGTLWGWGSNQYNMLGNNLLPQNQISPARIMNDIVAVSIGGTRTMAIRSCGSLFIWGEHWNEPTYIPGGASVMYSAPTHAINHVAAVAVGGWWHTSIIRIDGSLWTWGGNYVGQLGDGTTTGRRHPMHIMDNVALVSNSPWHTVVVQSDGSLWAWGSNEYGQLGDGTTTDRHYPVMIVEGVLLP